MLLWPTRHRSSRTHTKKTTRRFFFRSLQRTFRNLTTIATFCGTTTVCHCRILRWWTGFHLFSPQKLAKSRPPAARSGNDKMSLPDCDIIKKVLSFRAKRRAEQTAKKLWNQFWNKRRLGWFSWELPKQKSRFQTDMQKHHARKHSFAAFSETASPYQAIDHVHMYIYIYITIYIHKYYIYLFIHTSNLIKEDMSNPAKTYFLRVIPANCIWQIYFDILFGILSDKKWHIFLTFCVAFYMANFLTLYQIWDPVRNP